MRKKPTALWPYHHWNIASCTPLQTMTDLDEKIEIGTVGVVAEMQHRDRQDEGEIEPVRHEDVGLLAAEDGAEEHQQIGDPDDGEPQVGVPFRLGVFLALGDAEQVACSGDQDILGRSARLGTK